MDRRGKENLVTQFNPYILFLIRLMVVTCVRTFSHVRSCVFSAIISISVFEWPMLHTIQPFFILSICSLVTTDLFPVAVITISTDLTTCESFTTWKRRYNINSATKIIHLFYRFLILRKRPQTYHKSIHTRL